MSEKNDTITEINDSYEQFQLKEIYYNCSECKSPIEILKLNEIESIIEFKCINNNHKIKMKIKEYIDKMKKYNDKNIFYDICSDEGHEHNNYLCYCLDCKQHLCKKCLSSRIHKDHNKINILEVKPTKDELNIIEDIIKYYENEYDKLDKEALIKIKNISNKIKEYKIKINERKEIKLRENENNIKKELELNNNKYKSDIENIKNKYKNEIKLIKYKNENIIKEIKYKYKKKNEYDNIMYNNTIETLNKLDKKLKNKLNKEKEKLKNMKRLNEIIYDTYNIYSNNYYNSININNIINNYYNNNICIKKLLKVHNNKGKEYYKNGNIKYDGDFVHDKYEGNGKRIYGNGEYYIGQFLNGLRNGKGIEYYKNGNIKYDGDFVKDKAEGNGKFIWESGEYYIGQFEKGLFYGKGTLYYRHGNIKYDGDFIKGKYEGNGKFIYENGDFYIGQFLNGLKHGKGILYYKNGNIKCDGDFVNGKLVEKQNLIKKK